MHTQRQSRTAATRCAVGDTSGHAVLAEKFSQAVRNNLPVGMTLEEAWSVHRHCMNTALSDAYSATHNLVRLATLARTLDHLPTHLWAGAVPFTLSVAEVRIPPAEPSVIDPFYLIHALRIMVEAEKLAPTTPAAQLLVQMAEAHRMILGSDHHHIHVEDDAPVRVVALLSSWKQYAADYEPVFRHLLAEMLDEERFPFAAEKITPSESMTVIGVRFALIRLAVVTKTVQHQRLLTPEEQAELVATLGAVLARHASAKFVLAMAEETAWGREARLRALVGDISSAIPSRGSESGTTTL